MEVSSPAKLPNHCRIITVKRMNKLWYGYTKIEKQTESKIKNFNKLKNLISVNSLEPVYGLRLPTAN